MMQPFTHILPPAPKTGWEAITAAPDEANRVPWQVHRSMKPATAAYGAGTYAYLSPLPPLPPATKALRRPWIHESALANVGQSGRLGKTAVAFPDADRR